MTTSTNGGMLELRGLCRYFGATRAVNHVSFTVPAGRVFGYIGPNGAGKTTSMRILATLDQPTSGDAFVDGFSVVDDPDRVRQRLGFMPDSFGTYANVDVREYLDFFARAYGLKGTARLSAMDRVMQFTGLDELADKPMSGLSKGMKQRLCLGRALIHDPSVLVLDEPAAGLDPRARIQLREMIRDLSRLGKTILVSSHILSELAEMCDMVGIIERGGLLAVGRVEDIERAAATHQATRMSVRLRGDVEPALTWLKARPDVAETVATDDAIIFLLDGDADAQSDLLREMVQANLRVCAYGPQAKSLEDVFMQVTKGKVQ